MAKSSWAENDKSCQDCLVINVKERGKDRAISSHRIILSVRHQIIFNLAFLFKILTQAIKNKAGIPPRGCSDRAAAAKIAGKKVKWLVKE